MQQLLILSGKGGTGKTTVATAFIKLSRAKAYADCDVDAPNLHLLMQPKTKVNHSDYFGMDQAEIDPLLCVDCGICKLHCRFDAIANDKGYRVDPFACEGCGVCEAVCPVGAISMNRSKAGDLMLYKGEAIFSTAQLKMGRGTSGMLVTEVKKNLKQVEIDTDLAIIDGSPGIGCPVIASISGVDLVLVVAEPSVSGISDMMRIVETARKFQTPVVVCVNKFDTNEAHTEQIETFCREEQLPFMGRIPFDSEAVKAINLGHSIVDFDTISGRAVREVYQKTMEVLKNKSSQVLFPIK